MEGGAGVLDSLGEEIVAIVAPVSLCMLLVVLLVHSINPHGTNSSLKSVVTLAYTEKASDSTPMKFEGALINSLIFVVIVAIVTFLMVLLFYYRCVKCLKYYVCMSAALVLAYNGGFVFFMLVQALSIPLDIGTFSIVLFNFTVGGVLAVFLSGMPILVTQFYLVMIGMLVAFWFTLLPEWTTWVLLVALALYDLVAVLTPGGPLKLLVELAVSRNEEIPALIYGVRPSHQSAPPEGQDPSSRRRWRSQSRARDTVAPSIELQPQNGNANAGASLRESSDLERRVHTSSYEITESAADQYLGHESHIEDESAPLVRRETAPSAVFASRSDYATDPLQRDNMEHEEDAGLGLSSSGALKLGLGDFIFYSVLVGRAAMYDLTTVYACYLAIIAGLGTTLALLAVARRALPALPISIGLGVLFYLLTRLLMEPFVVGLSTTLVMF